MDRHLVMLPMSSRQTGKLNYVGCFIGNEFGDRYVSVLYDLIPKKL